MGMEDIFVLGGAVMIARCPRCGNVFSKDKFSICPACKAQENEKIDLLKHFVDENPHATLEQLQRISELTEEEILGYIRDNRLIVESDALKVRCESCGTPIIQGRFCRECRDRLSKGFSSAAAPLKARRKEIL